MFTSLKDKNLFNGCKNQLCVFQKVRLAKIATVFKNVKSNKMVEATSGLKSVEEQKLRMATSLLKILKTKTQVERTKPLR